jgi:hypothetical protein
VKLRRFFRHLPGEIVLFANIRPEVEKFEGVFRIAAVDALLESLD